MKLLFAILLLIPIISISQFKSLDINIKLLPEISQLFKDKEISVSLRYGDFHFDTTLINNLHFHIDSLPVGKAMISASSYLELPDLKTVKMFEWSYGNFPIADSSRAVFLKFDKDTTFLTIDFPRNCEANKSILNKNCPRCKNDKMVVPILYGLVFPPDMQDNKIIKEAMTNNAYEPGYCELSDCDPNWYCRKHKLKF